MKHRLVTAATLAMALALTLPSMALSEGRGRGNDDGDGKRGRGREAREQKSERREGRGNRGWNRAPSQGAQRQDGRRAWSQRETERSQRRVGGFVVDREPVRRDDTRYRWRTSDRPTTDTRYRWRTSDRGGYPRDYSRTRYRDGYRAYSSYNRPRYFYYTSGFSRPRFIHRSGFSIGFSIGSYPLYGYRYFDPYCDVYFGGLGSYYDHCYGHHHPETILVMYGASPVATCIYDEGAWVVDDCY